MPIVTAGRAAELCGGRLIGDVAATATSVVADSRSVSNGVGFVAVRTGHQFVTAALSAGAPFALVEREDVVPTGATAVVVDDMQAALMSLAAGVRSAMSVRVVAITGSTGKTLTKDLVATALRTRWRVHATPGSYNAEIGLPLTVLGCPDDADVLVAELGARHPGEIAELCEIVRPDIGVITGIGTTHIEVFGSRDAIARTKAELLRSLPADGLAVVPSDDDYLSLFAATTTARMATVGPGAAVRYRALRIDAAGRTDAVVTIGGRDVPLTLAIAGRPLVRNAALALCVARELGCDTLEVAASFAHAKLSGNRMQVVDIGGRTIINDAYNSNPTSVAAALRSTHEIASARGVRAWAVLGEMAELGPLTHDSHVEAGRLAAGLGYAGVLVVGARAHDIATGAGAIASNVESIEAAADEITRIVPSGDVVLIKASRVVALESLVGELRGRAGLAREER